MKGHHQLITHLGLHVQNHVEAKPLQRYSNVIKRPKIIKQFSGVKLTPTSVGVQIL